LTWAPFSGLSGLVQAHFGRRFVLQGEVPALTGVPLEEAEERYKVKIALLKESKDEGRKRYLNKERRELLCPIIKKEMIWVALSIHRYKLVKHRKKAKRKERVSISKAD